ncbi:MAG: hypothetical protein HRU14_12505 [Planctomycetes bacterium]|nr:hypothetical protein [Planctomycetota bacterium]
MLNVTLLALLVSALSHDEMANPEYRRWAAFEGGSLVVIKTIDEAHRLEITSTTTLKSKGDKEIALEIQISMLVAGRKIELPAQVRMLPATIEKRLAGEGRKKPETGEETLKIAQRDLLCTWTQTLIESGQSKIRSKVWMCAAVPGGLVRMESETSGATRMKMKRHLVSFVAK